MSPSFYSFVPRLLTLTVRAALLSAPFIAGVAMSGSAHAQAASVNHRFDIPAGALSTALTQVAAQAAVQLTADAGLTAGKTVPALKGVMTVDQALRRLLVGSGIEAVAQPGGSYVLRKGGDEVTLSAVKVRATDEQDSAFVPIKGYVARRSSTGTKTDTPTREVPQSISVVTRDSMDARGVSNLSEALEYAPGFTAFASGHDDRYDSSIARGIGETYNNNFRDGLKERGSVYTSPRLNTYGVERVEFLRGPASLLFGSNIPGGAVNSITKRPTDNVRGEIRVRGGNNDRQGIAADVSGPLLDDDNISYRLVGFDEKYDAPTPGARVEERYLAPALAFQLGTGTELILLANYQENRIDGDAYPYSYYEPVGDEYIPGSEKGWDRFDRDQWAVGYVLDHAFNDSVSLHSRGRYAKVTLDYRLTFANDFLSDDVVERIAQYIKDESKVWQIDNYLEAQWAIDRVVNTTIAGVDVSKVKGELYRGDGLTSPYSLAAGSGIGEFIAPELMPEYFDSTRQVGVYAQNQAKIDDRFVVVAGLRKDWYRTDANATTNVDSISQDALTGRLGGVWLLQAGFSPYVSYSTSFQPQPGVDASGDTFKPTKGRQYEIGLRYEPAQVNAQFSIAVFDIEQENVLTADPVDRNYSIQRGEIGSRGAEFEANASLSSRLDLTASYSYTDARVTKDTDPEIEGRKNAIVPRHKATVWLDYRAPLPGVIAGLGVRYSSKVPDAQNIRWVPGVTLVDARLGYELEHWEFALNARNLFDKEYLIVCNLDLCYPGDEREVIGSATYRW